MNVTALTALVGGVIVVGGVLAWNLIPRRERLRRFADRPDLSLEQIYEDFFGGRNLSKEVVCQLWKEVAEALHLPPGKLRPTDRFDAELAPPVGWEHDDNIMDVQWLAERRLKRSGSKADISKIRTLGDYVEFFCNLVAPTKQNNGNP